MDLCTSFITNLFPQWRTTMCCTSTQRCILLHSCIHLQKYCCVIQPGSPIAVVHAQSLCHWVLKAILVLSAPPSPMRWWFYYGDEGLCLRCWSVWKAGVWVGNRPVFSTSSDPCLKPRQYMSCSRLAFVAPFACKALFKLVVTGPRWPGLLAFLRVEGTDLGLLVACWN